MKKRIVIIVVVLALGIAGLYALRTWNQDANGHIRISGNIELTEITIAFKTAGRLVERAVDEGATVKKGMVLARLDRDQLLRQREAQQAALASAEAQLAQAGTSLEWQRQTLAADLEQRRADVGSSDARLLELKNGSRPQEISEAKAAVEAAQSELDRARKDWDRAQVLHKNDDISTSQFDDFRNKFQSAQAALKQAKEREALVQAGPRAEVIEAASAQAQHSRASLKMGQANELELKRRQQEVPLRRAEVDKARAQLALIDSQINDTVLTSPIDGVVLVKSADPGEVLAPGTAVMTIGDIDHPWLRGYLGERDLGKVKLGAKARVTTDSFPGKSYWGHVSFIASEAEFTPKQIQTKEERVKLVYRIKIDVDNPQHELKLNMPADAEILPE
ncbi:MAG: efflux RND transporter periplasmic adaptor subunit [Candidatus Solibacter usitatus]|nr:efflux RND transporter periplasmic adaptor subunit [Candidatus Solibacter usitatus]